MAIRSVSNGAVVLPVEYADTIIKGVLGRSKALELGRRLRDMKGKEYKLNVLSNLTVAGWTKNQTTPNNASEPELKNIPVSRLAWKDVDLEAEEISCIVPVSINTLEDVEDYGVEVVPQITEDVIGAFQQVIDATIFFGTNSPWRNFSGVVAGCTSANAVVSWNGQEGMSFYKAVNDAMKKVEKSGYYPSAILGSPELNGAFRDTITNLGVLAGDQGQIGALPRHIDMTGGFDASTAFAIVGDFKYLVYSFRKELDMRVLYEATINDPATGQPLYNLAQQNMVGFRFTMRLGCALPNPVQRVSATTGSGNTLVAGADAYPFAIITKQTGGSN